ncbi:MAG: hypothetical protein EBQ85_01185 [Proteobacteria bacterium]|nr:hypothetical protein [Pseudomonadota bacterium]
MERRVFFRKLVPFLMIFGSVAYPSVDILGLGETLTQGLRVFERVYEGNDQWAGSFCNGQYSYRLRVRTQINDVQIELNEDGSVLLNATLENPYFGFEGSYTGAYSLCFPTSAWTGLSADQIHASARIEFTDKEDGKVEFTVHVNSLALDRLHTGGLSGEAEETLTLLLNKTLKEVWTSQFGEWLSQQISLYINKNIPVKS